jgi:hypothetical protein
MVGCLSVKRLVLIGVAALFLATGAAQAYAGTRTIKLPTVTVLRTSLPPAEYDIPYTGELRIWVVQSKKDLREYYCKWTAANQSNWSGLACASTSKDKKPVKICNVYIAKDELLKAVGFNKALVLRHELGHCNGWANHEGGRLTPIDTKADLKLPPNTRWLRTYPPVACLTPDGQEESCTERAKPSTKMNGHVVPWANTSKILIERYRTCIVGCACTPMPSPEPYINDCQARDD